MSDAAGAASSRPLLMVSGFAFYGFGRVSSGDWSSRTPGGFRFFLWYLTDEKPEPSQWGLNDLSVRVGPH